jgi:hypothetical protein
MKCFLDNATEFVKWLGTILPVIFGFSVGFVPVATTAYFKWRALIEQLRKSNAATATAKEAVDTLVAAVEVCKAGDVKQVVKDSSNSPESQAVIDASISRKPTISK